MMESVLDQLAIKAEPIFERARILFIQGAHLRPSHAKYLVQSFREGPDSETWRVAMLIISLYAPVVFLDDHVTDSFASGKTRQDHKPVVFALVVVVLQVYQSLLRPDCLRAIPWSRKGLNGSPPPEGVEIDADDICTYAPQVPDRLIGTSLDTGLSIAEVEKRRWTYGLNEPFRPPSVARTVFDQQIAAWSAAVAAGFAVLAGHYWYRVSILIAGLILGVQGNCYSFDVQEAAVNDPDHNWDTSMPALVLRDGNLSRKTAKDLIPGDIVHVTTGTSVPADCRVRACSADYQVQSGNSEPYGYKPDHRDTGTACWISEAVIRGDAILEVVGTGVRTQRASIPVKRHSWKHGYRSAACQRQNRDRALIYVFSVTVVVAFEGLSGRLAADWSRILGLVAALAITFSRFTNEWPATTRAIVQSGEFAENGAIEQYAAGFTREVLSGVQVLCVDLGGMVTGGSTRALEPQTLDCDPEEVILAGALTRQGQKNSSYFGATHENELIDYPLSKLIKQYPHVKAKLNRYRVLDWSPSTHAGVTQALVETPSGKQLIYARGQPRDLRQLYQHNYDTMEAHWNLLELEHHNSQRAISTVGLVRKEEHGQWEILGALPIYDAVRFDARFAVNLLNQLGVSLKFFTPRSLPLSAAICSKVNLTDPALTKPHLTEPILTAKVALKAADPQTILRTVCFAETTPEARSRIISRLQSQPLRVAVAAASSPSSAGPILKRADCAIATAGSTPSAQEASHLVLLRPGLAALASTVQRARLYFHAEASVRVCEMVLLQVVVVLQLWWFYVRGELLSVRAYLMVASVQQSLAVCAPRWFGCALDIPFSARPVTVAEGRPMRRALPYAVVAVVGVVGLVRVLERVGLLEDGEGKVVAQAASLLLLAVEYAVVILVQSGPCFWTRDLTRRVLRHYGLWYVGATVGCYLGWLMPGSSLSLAVCGCVWAMSALTSGLLWFVSVAQPWEHMIWPDGEEMTSLNWPIYHAQDECSDHLESESGRRAK